MLISLGVSATVQVRVIRILVVANTELHRRSAMLDADEVYATNSNCPSKDPCGTPHVHAIHGLTQGVSTKWFNQ